MMKRVLILPIALLICQPALAQIPIDPLRLPDEETGGYIYTFGVNYIPSGRDGFDFDREGTPFNFETFNQSINFSVSGSYSFSRNLSISANVNPNLFIGRQKRDFSNRTQTLTETNTDIGAGLSVEYRPKPGSTLDPRFSVGVAYPWTVTVQGQASLIRDPVIVLGSLGYSQPLDSANSSLNLGLGAGFVANERVNFSAYANYAIPIGDTNLPVTSLSFRTGYNLDNKGDQDIGLRTTLSTRGGDTRLGVGIEWGGRGNIGSRRQNSNSTNNPESTNRNTPNVIDNTPSSVPSPSVNFPATQFTGNMPSAKDSNVSTNAVLGGSTRDAVQQLDRRLQEKDVQIEALQNQVIELQRSLERLRCQIAENKETCK
ncbi:outer membrane beta-barrel protein [Microcoleus sp. bin38.metabat.b11b12b14.051]|uniref:outer membrane beta-barrel protein n=1 Tax=Microcoleus sp. bin38.metabat.b11b12b14.051 TaxID=2742709 RepID=UPI0025F8B4FA|nr:outer membrane beta-barrel protein [Microcoleus sp. bin38.metabat.b11b12b14.051]